MKSCQRWTWQKTDTLITTWWRLWPRVEAEVVATNVENGDGTERDAEAKRQPMDCVCCEQSRNKPAVGGEQNAWITVEKDSWMKNVLKDDTKKVKYYTGIPCFAILLSLFNNVKAFLPASKKPWHFQMLLLTLPPYIWSSCPASLCAEVKIPAFTKGFCQLDAKDIEDTRAIAHLIIHVERVVGSLRNRYKMLHTTMPIRLLL